MAKIEFTTETSGFPTKGVDADVIEIGRVALNDGQVRSGPDSAETKQFVAALRTWAAAQTPPRKLKARTVGPKIYWQITKESPKKRSNGASPVQVSTVQAAANQVAAGQK